MIKTEVDEALKVHGRGPDRECGAVGFDTSVADSSMAMGDDPGDGSFDHGTVLAVVGGADAVGSVEAGLGEELVVGADPEGFAVFGCGAARPQRALVA